ncbi:hypothetical protein [Ferrimonas pelagia]|uniref:Uncharacterized protein n=1 Tax=Ferrimonas pelagia TaxID=1177826 RepID=A0ABP9EGZ9_9GAMM
MSAVIILSSALLLTPLSPEPVEMDTRPVHQEIQHGLEIDQAERQREFAQLELGTPVLIAQDADELTDAEAE